jgi:hypothetical protein
MGSPFKTTIGGIASPFRQNGKEDEEKDVLISSTYEYKKGDQFSNYRGFVAEMLDLENIKNKKEREAKMQELVAKYNPDPNPYSDSHFEFTGKRGVDFSGGFGNEREYHGYKFKYDHLDFSFSFLGRYLKSRDVLMDLKKSVNENEFDRFLDMYDQVGTPDLTFGLNEIKLPGGYYLAFQEDREKSPHAGYSGNIYLPRDRDKYHGHDLMSEVIAEMGHSHYVQEWGKFGHFAKMSKDLIVERFTGEGVYSEEIGGVQGGEWMVHEDPKGPEQMMTNYIFPYKTENENVKGGWRGSHTLYQWDPEKMKNKINTHELLDAYHKEKKNEDKLKLDPSHGYSTDTIKNPPKTTRPPKTGVEKIKEYVDEIDWGKTYDEVTGYISNLFD